MKKSVKHMFYVYVLRCRGGSLYAGYTNNLEKRIRLHKEGKASKYTRSRLPVEIAAKWKFKSKAEAMKYEAKFKALPKAKKIEEISAR